MSSHMLNGRESMKARELLSWNLHDLAHQTGFPPNLLAEFEKGRKQLVRHQNVKVREVFESNDIVFGEHMEVSLATKKKNEGIDRFTQMDAHVRAKIRSEEVLQRLRDQQDNKAANE